MTKEVTERDLRDPRFQHGEPSDYEFREDGSIALKNRWETGLRNIASIMGMAREPWEVDDIVNMVRELRERMGKIEDLHQFYMKTTAGKWEVDPGSNAINTVEGMNISTIHSGLSVDNARFIVEMRNTYSELFGLGRK